HSSHSLLRPDAVQIPIRADEELAARQRWAGVDAAGVAEVVSGEDLEILDAQDIGDAAAGEKGDGFADDNWRSIKVGQVLQGLALENAAVLDAQGVGVAAEPAQALSYQHRRAVAGAGFFLFPYDVRLGDVPTAAAANGHYQPGADAGIDDVDD